MADQKMTDKAPHSVDPVKLAAVLNSDAAYDGKFFYAVKSTGIFCRPSCRSRAPKPENLDFFDTRDAALAAGYRPCKRCRPDLSDYAPYEHSTEALREAIEVHLLDPEVLAPLLKALGGHQASVKAAFNAHYGCLPMEMILQKRLEIAARSLITSSAPILQIALSSGFSSQSAFYAAFKRAYHMSPGKFRANHQLI
ncbi:bifunctional transcriptional activator/DNA repair enzyme AdaA [Acidaminobacter hydrogenoformans]|uniref:AraC family transcriptional regulator, regulatory protein of adaptative response / methylphosphotriester-DNA alkyltransferase methyltransferase n=1 Tax=Acidaminobacter hydrogenoformans DSM 2784 TaxID=1120920 RepID=A0A1G5S7A3_9FIRM|nr:Ada metal-binding domain-containing protein [Acidaminobacter hydrogenoformans]SCZ81770.1 AraC family transcriptional regulator, regulatory protein of adaptative response / methylphosphotriester-DNA alkyltransferase methyltransferase [Acidaminobacter hydrogenoformans DSM 2784]